MRVYIYLTILVWVGLPGILWGQNTSTSSKKNTIEVFYLVNHFFDETRTNWTIWVPDRERSVVAPDGTIILR